jgi:glycosyltransferase involved in cell wall biosynthesis
MGEAISTFLRDPDLARRLGDHARKNTISNFDWRAISKKVAAVYDKLIKKSSPKGSGPPTAVSAP